MSLLKAKYSFWGFITILFLVFSFMPVIGQTNKLTEDQKIIKHIEDGFNNGSIDSFSGNFAEKIYLSITTAKPMYYSSNQAYWVLKDFIIIHTPAGFKFDYSTSESDNSFASGTMKYIKNGIKGKVTIFITLKKEKNQWKITHITIN